MVLEKITGKQPMGLTPLVIYVMLETASMVRVLSG